MTSHKRPKSPHLNAALHHFSQFLQTPWGFKHLPWVSRNFVEPTQTLAPRAQKPLQTLYPLLRPLPFAVDRFELGHPLGLAVLFGGHLHFSQLPIRPHPSGTYAAAGHPTYFHIRHCILYNPILRWGGSPQWFKRLPAPLQRDLHFHPRANPHRLSPTPI